MQIHKNFDTLEDKVHMNIPKTPFMKKRKEKKKKKEKRSVSSKRTCNTNFSAPMTPKHFAGSYLVN